MLYSAVSQPRPEPRSQRGTPSLSEAVHNTIVSPSAMRAEPAANLATAGSMLSARSSSTLRPVLKVVLPGRRVDAGEDQQGLGDAELHLPVRQRVEAGRQGESGVERGVERGAHEQAGGHGVTRAPRVSSESLRTRVRGIWRKRAPTVRKASTSPVA